MIGDSISVGYTVDVRKLLDGEADVFRIPSNGKDSAFGRSMIKRWLGKREWDVIHFNWGLWDLCYSNPEAKTQGHRDKENGTLTATPEKYRENLEAIVKRLKETEAELVWCETTPVPEKELGRIAGDAIRYNKVANELMAENGIAINELHAHALAKVHEIQKAEGDVHFTAEGSAYPATAVAEAIRAQLSE